MTLATGAAADLAAGDQSTLPADPMTKALGLARLGAKVLPCQLDKRPAFGWGVTRATSDPEAIVNAFMETGAPLVGVALGASSLIAIDIDRHPGGFDGFALLEGSDLDRPDTWAHTSLSGVGQHLVYSAPHGTSPTGSKPFAGSSAVQVKAGNEYIVWAGDVPPSRAAFASAPAWTLRGSSGRATPEAGDAQVADWLSANPGEPSGDLADAIAGLPPVGSPEWNNAELQRLAQPLVDAARWHFGGAVAREAFIAAYADGQWSTAAHRKDAARAFDRLLADRDYPASFAMTYEQALEVDRKLADAAERFVDGILQSAASSEATAPPFVVLTRADLRARPKPEWLIEGLLQGSGVLVLAGQGGIGKSFLALDWAAHLATGRPWHGLQSRMGRVLYVAAEGAEFFPDRLDAWEVHNRGFVPDDGLLFVETGFNLSDATAVAYMRHLVATEAFDLIVLDTLSQLSAVESENDNAQLATVIRQARGIREVRPGASVLIVHHVSKSEKGRVRGASAIRDNADSVIVARPEGGDGFFVSTRPEDDGKMKNAPAEVIHGLRLMSVESSAAVVRTALNTDEDHEAIAVTLADGLWHPIADFLGQRGDYSETASRRIRNRLARLVDAGQCSADGATSGRRWRSTSAAA